MANSRIRVNLIVSNDLDRLKKDRESRRGRQYGRATESQFEKRRKR